MKRVQVVLLIALAYCAFLIQCQSVSRQESKDFIVGSKDVISISGEEGFIDCGRFGILNNMWGSNGSNAYSQSVYRNLRTGVMGWEWNTGSLRTWRGNVKGYPSIYFGKSPFRNMSTAPDMPAKVTDFNKKVTFDYRLEAEGRYNTAIRSYIVPNVTSGPKDVSLEMMIWIDHVDFDGPKPDMVRGFSSNGRSFQFELKKDPTNSGLTSQDFSRTSHWIFARFVADKPLRSATLSLGNFARFLVLEGLVPPSSYVTSIEFGNEIIAGKGRMTVKKFKIE